MSKRVYEIARERSLETREVMDRLKDAGVEVTNHFGGSFRRLWRSRQRRKTGLRGSRRAAGGIS
jgi:hypothetical protein